jgi:hypothetical protein
MRKSQVSVIRVLVAVASVVMVSVVAAVMATPAHAANSAGFADPVGDPAPSRGAPDITANPPRKKHRRVLARLSMCFACGGMVEAPLARLGSLRCHKCIDEAARLNPRLVREWKRRGGGF